MTLLDLSRSVAQIFPSVSLGVMTPSGTFSDNITDNLTIDINFTRIRQFVSVFASPRLWKNTEHTTEKNDEKPNKWTQGRSERSEKKTGLIL